MMLPDSPFASPQRKLGSTRGVRFASPTKTPAFAGVTRL